MDLFAKEPWYKSQKEKEQDFVGVLKKTERKGGVVGFGRFNPYRLEMAKETREVYVGGKPAILAPFVGKKVRITGKPVEIGVEGRLHHEIWPARLVVLADGAKEGVKDAPADTLKGDDKNLPILARAFWPHGSTNPDMREKASQFVLRSAEELTRRPPFNNLDAPPAAVEKMATEALAKALKVPTIDWKKQMLVVVTGGTQSSGGFRIGVTALRPVDGKLIVDWFLAPPTGFATTAFTHPAEVVLTNRFEGVVEFRPVPAPKTPGRD